jgi:membrane protease YdiL (CAAX protease family)
MDIKKMNENLSPQKKVEIKETQSHSKLWIGSFIIMAIICIGFYFLFQLQVFNLLGTYRLLLRKLSLAASICFVVLIIAKIAERLVLRRSHEKSLRYNVDELYVS